MLLTEQEIYELADDGVFLGNVKEITRAIEAKVIEKIKAQGPTVYSCDVLQADATFKLELSTVEPPTGMYSIRNIIEYYRLPEGD